MWLMNNLKEKKIVFTSKSSLQKSQSMEVREKDWRKTLLGAVV